jgi:excinuclease ABC subunit A
MGSLCIDTLYAEGQRRFVESFSPYARQFLERHERPPVDRLDPVAAAIAIDRRERVRTSRSTVATMGDIEPYLSALFFREGVPVCDACQCEAQKTTVDEAADGLLSARQSRDLEARQRIVHLDSRRALPVFVDCSSKVGAYMDDVRPSEVMAKLASHP